MTTQAPKPPQPAVEQGHQSTSTSVTVDAQIPESSKETFKLPESMPIPPPLSTIGHTMPFFPKDNWQHFTTSLRLFCQLRGRLSKNTVLTARLTGNLSEQVAPSLPFTPKPMTFQMLLEALRLAAYDPRIAHVHLRIDPLSCGWAKVIEIRRHLDHFAASGKTVSAFMESGGPKEYFIAMGFALYVPPDGNLSLRGFTASATFLRGVLDNIGVSPQVERIGKYKSAGDQLSRKHMAPEQRETLISILDDTHSFWMQSVCCAVRISMQDLTQFLDRSPWDMEEYVEAGLITGMCYESELTDALKKRFNNRLPKTASNKAIDVKAEEDLLREKLRSVEVVRYMRITTPRLLGIDGQEKIGVIRAIGTITPGKSRNSIMGRSVGSDTLVELIRRARFDKSIKGVLLRVDSPGGTALASDIVWNELKALRKVKPVVASQGDVAASGGYYLSMACEIVSECLTLTGSIGIVSAKPSLQRLYERIGFNKENLSIGGRFAELLVEDRPFNEEESRYFRQGAELAYDKFVRKAASSRNKSKDEMEQVAQGRVWTGGQALEQGLVDHIGGTSRALEVLKNRCDIKDKFVKVEELKAAMSLRERLGLSNSSSMEMHGEGVDGILNQPLAMADIDPALGDRSPFCALLLDVALCPLMNMFANAGIVRWRDALVRELKAAWT